MSCDERRGKQIAGGVTFPSGGCVLLADREYGGSGDGGDPHGDSRGDPCDPSPNNYGGREEGNRALYPARRRNGLPFRLGEKYYYMIVKKRGGIAPSLSPPVAQDESARAGVLVGANVE